MSEHDFGSLSRFAVIPILMWSPDACQLYNSNHHIFQSDIACCLWILDLPNIIDIEFFSYQRRLVVQDLSTLFTKCKIAVNLNRRFWSAKGQVLLFRLWIGSNLVELPGGNPFHVSSLYACNGTASQAGRCQ